VLFLKGGEHAASGQGDQRHGKGRWEDFDKTSTRVANARTALLGGSSDGKSSAQDTVGQGLDMIQVALDLVRAFADRPPTAFIDIQTPGGGGTGSPNTTATLDDPVGTIGLLQVTPLVSPGIGSTLTMGVTALGTAVPIEQITITVTVPNNQAPGLYSGFISSGGAVQVEVYVSVHT